MRVGLIGAPGSGKSKLGRLIAKEYEITLVDNYVQRLQKATNLALGPWSSYAEHMVVAGHRYAAEEKVGPTDRVTAGTMIDTLTYAMVKSDVEFQYGTKNNTEKERIAAMYASAQAGIRGLTLFLTETWDYDLSFFLPFSDDAAKKADPWSLALDNAYPAVIESYNPPYTWRLDGTTEERFGIVKESIDFIREKQETEATEAVEPTV